MLNVLSPWIAVEGHCATRVYAGTDPDVIANRVAFIEKTPRVRVNPFTAVDDFLNWSGGPKGCGEECGNYTPSREWCDQELVKMGYILT